MDLIVVVFIEILVSRNKTVRRVIVVPSLWNFLHKTREELNYYGNCKSTSLLWHC